METKETAKTIQRLLSITETGLAFSRDEFDQERYLELRQLLGYLLADWSDLDGKELAELLRPTDFYATPLIDVRAVLVRDGKVCLLRGKMRILGLYLAAFVKSAYLLRKISSRKSKKKRDLMFQFLVCLQSLILINFNFRVSNMLNWSSSVR